MNTLKVVNIKTVVLKILVGAMGFIAVAAMLPRSIGATTAIAAVSTSTSKIGNQGAKGGASASNDIDLGGNITGGTMESAQRFQSGNLPHVGNPQAGTDVGVSAPGATTTSGLGYSGTGTGALRGSSSTPGAGGIPRVDTGTGFGTSTGIGSNTGTNLNHRGSSRFSSSQNGLNYNSPDMSDADKNYGAGPFTFDAPLDLQRPMDSSPTSIRPSPDRLQVEQ